MKRFVTNVCMVFLVIISNTPALSQMDFWLSNGPYGARVFDLVVDQANSNLVYIGTISGVWKTADGGLNWMKMENGFPDTPDLEVQDLAPHPTNSAILYAATKTAGIYRTDNAGATWMVIISGLLRIQNQNNLKR